MLERPIVIDASVTMAWCFRDEITPRTEAAKMRVMTAGAVVPAHWSIEVQNSLRLGERRRKATRAEINEFVRFMQLQLIEIDHRPLNALGELLPICRQHSLNAQDAAYIELALRRALPLATRDHQIESAARELGIELLDRR